MDIPCLGIEPTRQTAEAAIAKGIPTEISFFTTSFAEELAKETRKSRLDRCQQRAGACPRHQ